MRSLEIGIDNLKQLAAWSAEKAGRLKLNGSVISRSPLSLVVELEALTLGVTGKLGLWRALLELAPDEPLLDARRLRALARRAEAQREKLENQRLRVARDVLAGGRAGSS